MFDKDKSGKELIEYFLDTGMIRIWPRHNAEGWILHSGIWSPFYIQLRPLCSKMQSKLILSKIGDSMASLISSEAPNVNRLVGVATAGIPIAVITTFISGIPSCYTRKIENVSSLEDLDKELESYGEHSVVEGDLLDDDRIMLIDDVITNGSSKLIARRLVEHETGKRQIHAVCDDVAVVVDREQGGAEELAEHGVKLHSLIPFKSKGVSWLRSRLTAAEHAMITDYLKDNEKYQDPGYRSQVKRGIDSSRSQ